jgi:hypothetical protein
MGPVRIALAAAAVVAAVTACSGPAPSAGSHVGSATVTYYLALGDSLSVGVQPDAAGTGVETAEGYSDQLYAVLHRGQPTLQLVNDLLERTYATAGVRVANVFGAFETSDFGNRATVPGVGSVPRNVARICQWTWECAGPPRGPNQHANQAGYGVIAQAFLNVAGPG